MPTVRPGAGIKGRPAEERENRRGRSNSLAQVLNSGAPVETDKAVGGIDDCAGAAREHGWYGRRWRSWRTNSFPSRVSYTISPCALCRQKPKVGAECPNWARWDLCGGPVMSVPAANTSGSALVKGFGCRPIVAIAAGSEGRRTKASQEGTRGPPCGRGISMGI